MQVKIFVLYNNSHGASLFIHLSRTTFESGNVASAESTPSNDFRGEVLVKEGRHSLAEEGFKMKMGISRRALGCAEKLIQQCKT
jgi:hypothetical protein